MAGNMWTKTEDKIVKKLYPTTSATEIAEKMGRSILAVYQRARILGLKKSAEYLSTEASGRYQRGQKPSHTVFKKGRTPWNQGMKGLQIGGKETQFKKGHLPHNTKENFVISIRKDRRGVPYKFIRVALAQWMPLQRYNWEQVHGKIPPKMKLIFKDRDTLNCAVDNLELVSCGQLMKRNSVHNYPVEVACTIQLRGALNRQIRKHIKKFKDEE